jgi:hypothetical protein
LDLRGTLQDLTDAVIAELIAAAFAFGGLRGTLRHTGCRIGKPLASFRVGLADDLCVAFGRDLAARTARASTATALPVVFCEGTGLLGLCGAVRRISLKFLAAQGEFFAATLFFNVESALLAFGFCELAEAVGTGAFTFGLRAGACGEVREEVGAAGCEHASAEIPHAGQVLAFHFTG